MSGAKLTGRAEMCYTCVSLDAVVVASEKEKNDETDKIDGALG